MTWRPIKSAPKDGRTILVYRFTPPAWHVIGMGYWFESAKDGSCGCCGWIVRGILSQHRDSQTLGLAHPTHWMPLPEPPA